jgi:formate hydrogenlyase transcriptional activator
MPANSFPNTSRGKAGAAATGGAKQDIEEIPKPVGLGVATAGDYQALQRLVEEREALLNINRAIGRHLDRDELFGALASCLQTVLPAERFGIELPIEGDKLKGHILSPRAGQTQPTQTTVLPARGTACDWVLQNRDWVVVATRQELRERFPVTFKVMQEQNMESLCALPLVTGGRSRGALFFMSSAPGAYRNASQSLLEQVAEAVAVALDDCLAHEEVRRLRDQLAAENVYLQEEIRSEHNFEEIVGNCPALVATLKQAEQVSQTDSTVLLLGETGTGKEIIARAIHNRSPRKDRALVKVNCGAISAGLVESELFGHVKGAFTGALANRDGRFKLADGGTLFLDEVSELPADTQVKLLRVLQEQEFEPIGSSVTVRVDVRIIAATNRDLEERVREGKFRADLFYRLNVFPITVPPLRQRGGDISLLAIFFMEKFARKLGKEMNRISEEAMRRLTSYAWPGNIRELQNVIERAVILSPGPTLTLDREQLLVPLAAAAPSEPTSSASSTESASLSNVERRHIQSVLEQTGWVIEGARGAARILSLHPNTLRFRMQKLGIVRPHRGRGRGSEASLQEESSTR